MNENNIDEGLIGSDVIICYRNSLYSVAQLRLTYVFFLLCPKVPKDFIE